MSPPPGIGSALAARRCGPEAVLDHTEPDADLIAGLGNGEPATVIDALEAGADRLSKVRIHRMLPLRDRAYIDGSVEDCATSPGFSPRTTGRPFTAATAISSPTTSARCRR